MPRPTRAAGFTVLLVVVCTAPMVALRLAQAPGGAAAVTAIAGDGAHWKGDGIFGKGILYDHPGPEYTVYAQRRDRAGAIEVHEQDTDIIFVMGGSATFVTGGTLIGRQTLRPFELTGTDVQQGAERQVSRGDVFIVPKGTIHWFKTVTGSVSYYAIKIHEPEASAIEPAAAIYWNRADAFSHASPLYDGGQAHRYQLFAVERKGPGIPEVHEKDTDIVFFLDGSATWTIGGDGGGGGASKGNPRAVASDDAVIVAPQTRHWFERVPARVAYYAVKIY